MEMKNQVDWITYPFDIRIKRDGDFIHIWNKPDRSRGIMGEPDLVFVVTPDGGIRIDTHFLKRRAAKAADRAVQGHCEIDVRVL